MVNANEDSVNEPKVEDNFLARRVLLGKKVLKPCQRRNLTGCKSRSNCWKMIVDSGGIDNLVAEEMVQKHGLKRVRHPCPYRINWLQDEHSLGVREYCLVDFQIGQYVDQVLCDIVDMNSCHILLGSPWQHDCKAVHDCVKTVFTIEKGGRKFSLIPLQNVELGRRNLSFGRRVELNNSRRVRDHCEKQICRTPKTDVKQNKQLYVAGIYL